MIKALRTLALFLLMPLLLSACWSNSDSLKATQSQILVFGTYVDLTIYSNSTEQSKRAIQQVEQRFQQFHH